MCAGFCRQSSRVWEFDDRNPAPSFTPHEFILPVVNDSLMNVQEGERMVLSLSPDCGVIVRSRYRRLWVSYRLRDGWIPALAQAGCRNPGVDVDFIKTTYDISPVFLHFFVTFRILSPFRSHHEREWRRNPNELEWVVSWMSHECWHQRHTHPIIINIVIPC